MGPLSELLDSCTSEHKIGACIVFLFCLIFLINNIWAYKNNDIHLLKTGMKIKPLTQMVFFVVVIVHIYQLRKVNNIKLY